MLVLNFAVCRRLFGHLAFLGARHRLELWFGPSLKIRCVLDGDGVECSSGYLRCHCLQLWGKCHRSALHSGFNRLSLTSLESSEDFYGVSQWHSYYAQVNSYISTTQSLLYSYSSTIATIVSLIKQAHLFLSVNSTKTV